MAFNADENDDFSVDRFNLEIEAERNPGLMRKYGKKLAVAAAETKDAKRNLEYIESECAEIIRGNLSAYDIKGKPTDKLIFGLVKGEEEYKNAFRRYKIAVKREEDLKSAIDTIRQRGMMIRILEELWLNKYYSQIIVKDDNINRRKRLRLQTIEAEENTEPDF